VIRNFHITPTNLHHLVAKLHRLDPHTDWVCDVTEKKTKRSHEQNSRYWSLLTDFGRYLGYESEELHEVCRYKFLREYAEVGGERVEKLKSTTKLTTAEFTEYMDAIDRWAVSLGFVWQEAV